MNTQITLDNLSKLKLSGMARAYQAIVSMPVHEQPSADQLLARLTEAELQEKASKKTEMFLRLSKLRYTAMPIAILQEKTCWPLQTVALSNGLKTF